MADAKTIREAAEHSAEVLTRMPSRGRLTDVTKARMVDGLFCEIDDGPWALRADMPVKAGGTERAPTPGVLGRGALASCLVIGISAWVARRGIALEALEVEVQADFDARGELGLDESIPPGYQEIRYVISIDGPAPESTYREIVDTALRFSPYFDVLGRAQQMKGILRLNGKQVRLAWTRRFSDASSATVGTRRSRITRRAGEISWNRHKRGCSRWRRYDPANTSSTWLAEPAS